jgi:ketosteroid isomerase-like protein
MSTSTRDLANLDAARQYLAAIQRGATGDALAQFFAPDVVQEEFPNRVVPDGKRRNLAAMLEGAERGRRCSAGNASRFAPRSPPPTV